MHPRTMGGVLTIEDADYPDCLRQIADPPRRLYFAGDLRALLRPAVSVVGARRCTALGRSLARDFACQLGSVGIAVVSGLAHGIDAAAHEGACGTKGATVAVLGSGIEHIYPARNRGLAQRIVACGGLLLSEHERDVLPAKHHFPKRNRIISGLSSAVLVVEASDKSGSLITARLALEQGRDVFAVPGAINSPVAAGCNRLLREGAAVIDHVDTLFFELGIERPDEAPPPEVSNLARQVLENIGGECITADEIVARSDWSVQEVLAALSELEMAGIVSAEIDGYSRRPEQ